MVLYWAISLHAAFGRFYFPVGKLCKEWTLFESAEIDNKFPSFPDAPRTRRQLQIASWNYDYIIKYMRAFLKRGGCAP